MTSHTAGRLWCVLWLGWTSLGVTVAEQTPSELPLETQSWIPDAANPVLIGDALEIHHLSDPSVIRDGSVYRMWFGFVGKDESVAKIGYAISADGATWTLHPSAVLSPASTGHWDDLTTEIPSVIIDVDEPDESKRYKMWYGGSSTDAPNLTKIGYATSPDGVSWTRLEASASPFGQEGLVMTPSNALPGDFAIVAEPSVIKRGGRFEMWYSSWDGDALVISHATSPDGIAWTKNERNPVLRHTPEAWEAGGLGVAGTVAQPTVAWDGARYLMWYGSFDDRGLLTYTGIGFASSLDGVVWTKSPRPVLVPLAQAPGEQVGIGTGPTVLLDDGTLHIWYGSVDEGFRRVINHRTSEP